MKSGPVSATCSTMPSRFMISMFLSAIAHMTGCPPNVMPWREHARAGRERLHHAVVGDDGADRRVGRGQALGGQDHVRLDVVLLRAEPGAEAAEAVDDLVGDQQDAVVVADLADALEVALRRGEDAAGVLDRLHDHHRDRGRVERLQRVQEVVEQEVRELLLRLPLRAVVAVGVAAVADLGDERLERRAQRPDAVDRQRAHGGAVVGDVAADGLPALLAARRVVLAGELPGGLDGLGAAGDEEDAVEAFRGEARRPRRRARWRAGGRSSSSCRRAARASARAPPGPTSSP